MNQDVKKYCKQLKKIANKGTFEVVPSKNKLTVRWQMNSKSGSLKNIICHMARTPSCHRWRKNSSAFLNRTFNEMNIQATIK